MKYFKVQFLFLLVISSCQLETTDYVLPHSTGRTNGILTVVKTSQWVGEVGDALRSVLGEHIVGLPQPETQLSVSQVAPRGFIRMMKMNRNILVIEQSDTVKIATIRNKYAAPQTIVYLTAKDKKGLIALIEQRGKEVIATFKAADIQFLQHYFYKKKLATTSFKTLGKLGIDFTIPKEFRLVDDTGAFFWLRQHLKSGLRGDGNNNLLVYSLPLPANYDALTTAQILAARDTIGKTYLPGSKEGRYMITEALFTPETTTTTIAGMPAYETRGKWEVKNDFMAGPFLNYTIVDTANNRLLVVEGFTYAPSINKREFVFELEAIAKSLKMGAPKK